MNKKKVREAQLFRKKYPFFLFSSAPSAPSAVKLFLNAIRT
jgi:hypothetical protein